jgi:isoleucyl-tRNA synthetase
MATDYKNTLNLPRTDFPMKADLVAREPERLKQWGTARLYERIQARRAGAEKFVLHDGPPFANGEVHIGTALNKILKDVIIKYKTLRGFSAPFVPGWDCHGLPIEFKVVQQMSKEFEARWPEIRKQHEESLKNKTASVEMGIKYSLLTDSLSPERVRSACKKSAEHFIDVQRRQFKRLGVLGDWEKPYLTLNKEYEAEELRLFADIVEKGFVYRAKKPVYWSIPCRTALAEAEVEYRDHVSPSIYVKFRIDVENSPKEIRSLIPQNAFVLIWTTTPWTLSANLAVAFNSNFTYCFIRNESESGVEHLLVLTELAPKVVEKAGLKNAKILSPNYPGRSLALTCYEHPFIKRKGQLFDGNTFVTNDTGTGFVHIAPGHGLDDYNLGLAVGLPIYSPVTDHGTLRRTKDLQDEEQMPDSLIGKSLLEENGKPSEANESVLELLREKSVLLHQEECHHSYPHCWRSKTPIIFRAMDQWFIKIDHVVSEGRVTRAPNRSQGLAELAPPNQSFRTRALAEIDRVNWIPDWGVNRIKSAVQSRPDWCISRQRAWGVPIPAFLDGEKWILDARVIRRFADEVEKYGTNFWFAHDAAYLYGGLRLHQIVPVGDPSLLKKSNDTLDVWIDSGSSSRSVLMRRKELLHEVGRAVPSAPRRSEDTAPYQNWQADMYLEGSDQHRGWFQSSLLLSLAGNGAAPFKTVLTHGFVVDADREKISKSKQSQGVYEKPQTAEAYVKKYGADIVRLWISSQDFRNDIIVSEERINKVAETYRVIRNALRYQLSNLYDFEPAKHAVPDDRLTGLDRWILGEFSKLEQEVIRAYDDYEFHVVYQKVSQFAAVELSAIYHDVIKDRLYTDPANSPRRRSTQTALHRLVTGLCKMLAPILVFTSDEAWEYLPKRESSSVHESQWTPKPFNRNLEGEVLEYVRALALPKLEEKRQAKLIGKSLEAKVVVRCKDKMFDELAAKKSDFIERLGVSQVAVEKGSSEVVEIVVTKADGQKCARCWHWETDVGKNSEHPTLCGRCVEAVKAFKV